MSALDLEHKNFTLVHICCSVDSHHFLLELQKTYPEKKFCGFFYNPNIHPFEEYQMRFNDVKRSCEKLGVPLYEGEYDIKEWFGGTKGLEDAPEKGERCSYCFDYRLERSAKKALEIGCKEFTTTLLASPMKLQHELFAQGKAMGDKYHLGFLPIDVRSGGGTQIQNKRAKEANLYRQNYCGCLYGLKAQREKSKKIPLELFSSLNHPRNESNLPQLRLKNFKTREILEKENQNYEIIKRKVMCYKMLKSLLCDGNKNVISSFVLDYSYLSKSLIKAKVDFWQDGIGYANKEGIVFLEFSKFQKAIQKDSFQSLLNEGLSTKIQMSLRNSIYGEGMFVSPIVLVESSFDGDFTLELEYKMQEEILEDFIRID